MLATLVITLIGTSVGFVIPPLLAEDLQLEVGDRILVTTKEIIREGKPDPIELHLRGKVIRSGGKHGSFIIEKAIATHLRLEKGHLLNADIIKEHRE